MLWVPDDAWQAHYGSTKRRGSYGRVRMAGVGVGVPNVSPYTSPPTINQKKIKLRRVSTRVGAAPSCVSEFIFLVILYPLGHHDICVFSTLLTWAIWGFESVQEVRVETLKEAEYYLLAAFGGCGGPGHQSQMWPTTDSDTIIPNVRSGRSRSFNHWQITRITVNPMPLGG